MNLTLYKNSSDNRCINKKIKQVLSLSGNLKNESSIMNPTVIIETNIIDFNYLYIKEFNRYYYVNNITILRNNLIQVDTSVDVLMSNKDVIKYLPCLVERVNDSEKIDEFIDTATDVERGETTEIKTFPQGFNDSPTFILCTLSGNVETFNIEDDPQESAGA